VPFGVGGNQMYKIGSQVEGTIKEYKEALQNLGVKVTRAILYGSYALGNQRKDSDIDLIIISDDFRKMNLRERLEILGIAAARIMKPVEAKGYTPEEIEVIPQASFLSEILKTSVSV